MADKSNKINLLLLSPEKKLFNGPVDMIIMSTTEGDIGVLHGHQPLSTVLTDGLLKIFVEGESSAFAVFGGFAEVTPQQVTILSDLAERPEDIDTRRAEDARDRAERLISERSANLDVQRAEHSSRRANVRLDASAYSILHGGKKE